MQTVDETDFEKLAGENVTIYSARIHLDAVPVCVQVLRVLYGAQHCSAIQDRVGLLTMFFWRFQQRLTVFITSSSCLHPYTTICYHSTKMSHLGLV